MVRNPSRLELSEQAESRPLPGFILPAHTLHDILQFPPVRGDQVFFQGACLELHHDVVVIGTD